ncbi:hypothetical protein GN956_G6240 [Arapaima gigas]
MGAKQAAGATSAPGIIVLFPGRWRHLRLTLDLPTPDPAALLCQANKGTDGCGLECLGDEGIGSSVSRCLRAKSGGREDVLLWQRTEDCTANISLRRRYLAPSRESCLPVT